LALVRNHAASAISLKSSLLIAGLRFDGGDAFIVENNDSVGINLATPSANSASILFSDDSARGQGRIIYDHASDYMGFHTSGISSERMRIDADGNPINGTPRAQNSTVSETEEVPEETQRGDIGTSTDPVVEQPAYTTPTPSAPRPVADAGLNIIALVGDEVVFDGANSTGSGLLTFEWNLGDGNTKSGESITYTYQFPGTYIVVLTVSDGTSSSQSQIEANIFPAGIVLSEFLPNPASAVSEWIEIHNNGDSFVDISGWGVGTKESKVTFRIPENTFISEIRTQENCAV